LGITPESGVELFWRIEYDEFKKSSIFAPLKELLVFMRGHKSPLLLPLFKRKKNDWQGVAAKG
jgi:hypothetical protein